MNLAPESDEFAVWTDPHAEPAPTLDDLLGASIFATGVMFGLVLAALAWGVWGWWTVLHG